MIKILVGVSFGFVAAVMTTGCTIRTEPAVVVLEPAPVVVYQPTGRHLPKHKRQNEDDQGENEQ